MLSETAVEFLLSWYRNALVHCLLVLATDVHERVQNIEFELTNILELINYASSSLRVGPKQEIYTVIKTFLPSATIIV